MDLDLVLSTSSALTKNDLYFYDRGPENHTERKALDTKVRRVQTSKFPVIILKTI